MLKTITPRNLALIAAALLAVQAPSFAAAKDYYAFIGGGGRNFSLSHFDTDTGVLTTPVAGAATASPTFFAISADGKFLYTCNEGNNGMITAFSINQATGDLTMVNTTASGGSGPCHIAIDKTGKYLGVANYNSGSIAIFPIKPDGSIGDHTDFDQHPSGSNVVPSRQAGPHAHIVVFDPSNKYILDCDLGADQVMVYKFNDKNGTIAKNDPAFVATKPGNGPRHLVFNPNGKIVYVTNELNPVIDVYSWDSTKGTLTPIQTVPRIPSTTDPTNVTGAEIVVDAKGKFLYASNRNVEAPSKDKDSVGVFSIADDGKLTWVQDVHVDKVPRFITLDPSGKYLLVAAQGPDRATEPGGNTIAVFAVDAATGKLTAKGTPVAVAKPECIEFLAVPAKVNPVKLSRPFTAKTRRTPDRDYILESFVASSR